MGLEELQPGNTLRAKATAVAAFSKFLKGEEVEAEFVRKCIEADESGKSFVCVMDKFGMYLAFSEGKKGKLLARNTAMQYYRQAKIWLLEQFPQHRASLESRLLKMGKTLDSFCLKRDGGGFVTKAPPCTKADLKKMMVYLYTNSCSESDYQDAALLCLLWYLFGRASDLSMIKKRNISIDAADVFFLRLVRVKTSEEQGLSLFRTPTFLRVPCSLSRLPSPSKPHRPQLSSTTCPTKSSKHRPRSLRMFRSWSFSTHPADLWSFDACASTTSCWHGTDDLRAC
ncbi:Glucose-6-phosphate isomerase [Phytophthora nicotianae]|uniref:Glucose-6-phosphate isomerase n=1 Tax=Phytophthora nicotianae TaxID=4792 RepID=A0A0W8DTF1_PHYNI|nr:Glucose-6-phosphate isomerase [Phytophthora nicotianae]